MTITWQTITEQQLSLPLNPVLESSTYFIPLPQFGILKVEGEDADEFLQNLFTNDVAALDINQGHLSGFCNAKGRLFSLFFLIRIKEQYLIVLPKTMCEILQQRLQMYILRSKVVITDISDTLACIGLKGSTASIAESINQDDHFLTEYPSIKRQFLYFCPKQQAGEVCQNLLNQQWQLTSEKTWGILNIEAGLPSIFPESKEKFTPQQVNLDLINGVSFSKGCYPGQEVVARLHYLGSPSRRMFLATAESNTLPNPGSEVTGKDTKVIGHVVRAEYSDINGIKLLLSLKLSELNQNTMVDGTISITSIQTLENS